MTTVAWARSGDVARAKVRTVRWEERVDNVRNRDWGIHPIGRRDPFLKGEFSNDETPIGGRSGTHVEGARTPDSNRTRGGITHRRSFICFPARAPEPSFRTVHGDNLITVPSTIPEVSGPWSFAGAIYAVFASHWAASRRHPRQSLGNKGEAPIPDRLPNLA